MFTIDPREWSSPIEWDRFRYLKNNPTVPILWPTMTEYCAVTWRHFYTPIGINPKNCKFIA